MGSGAPDSGWVRVTEVYVGGWHFRWDIASNGEVSVVKCYCDVNSAGGGGAVMSIVDSSST